MADTRRAWLTELCRFFILALRDSRELDEMLSMNRDLLCQARIEIVKAGGGGPLQATVDGHHDSSVHAATLRAACKPLNTLLIALTQSPRTNQEKFWKIVRMATISEDPGGFNT